MTLPVIIGPLSDMSIPEAVSLGLVAGSSQPLNAANDAYFYPFTLSEPFTVVKAGWINGATVNGNVDIGVYSENGTKIWSSGSTAQSGTSAGQAVTPTAFTLPPGKYYMAISSDSATATFLAMSGGEVARAMGILIQSVFPLPSTMGSVTAISATKTRSPHSPFLSRRSQF